MSSEFGQLIIPKYLRWIYKDKLTNAYYINNTTNLDFLVKIFKEDWSGLIVFSPNMNYRNAWLIFEGFYKKVERMYFGQELTNFNKVVKELEYFTKE